MEYAILAVIFVVVGFAIWRESKKDAGANSPAPAKPPAVVPEGSPEVPSRPSNTPEAPTQEK